MVRLDYQTLVLTPIALVLLAAGDASLPPSVTAAQTRHDRLLAKAQSEYERAVADADRAFAGELDTAVKDALHKGNLDQANAIAALKKDVQGNPSGAGRGSATGGRGAIDVLRSMRAVGASVRAVGGVVAVTGDGLMEKQFRVAGPIADRLRRED